MKKIIIIFIVQFTFLSLLAQNSNDVYKVSDFELIGNARYVSMGGAFNSVGGTSSALLNNPAGIGLYRRGEFSFTTSYLSSNATSKYIGMSADDSDNYFSLDNFSLIGQLAFDNPNTGWYNISAGVIFNKLNDFSNSFFVNGVNTKTSMIDDFVAFANHQTHNLNQNNLDAREHIASEVYLINFDKDKKEFYNPYNKNGYGHTELLIEESSGYLNELAFVLGASYEHKLYLGGSIGFRTFNYRNKRKYKEDDPKDVINDLSNFTYNSESKISGNGFNLSVGAIYRPVDFIRLGMAIQTPTIYFIKDALSLDMQANYDDSFSTNIIYHDFSDIDYKLNTPFRFMTGGSLYLGKKALISVDYELIDYSMSEFKSSDEIESKSEMNAVNKQIENKYQIAHKISAGGEYRIGFMSLRGGYVYKTSPYKSSDLNSDYIYSAITGGLGFNFNNFYMDFAYVHEMSEIKQIMYGETFEIVNNKKVFKVNPVEVDFTKNRLVMTLGFRF